MFPLLIALLLLVPSFTAVPATSPNSAAMEMPAKIRSAADLIQKMKSKAEKSELKEYTFVQQTIRYDETGNALEPSTWYEAVRYPDKLRIDMDQPGGGQTALYRDDSLFIFQEGKLVNRRDEKMEFLLLEGGLKFYSAAQVLKMMAADGYDLGTFRTDEYQGKPVYVIGAGEGDLAAKQVWIDQKHLHQVRRIDQLRGEKVLEVRFLEHTQVMDMWIPLEIEFYLDGKLLQTEVYQEITGNPGLKSVLFDPNRIDTWHWFGNKN